MDAVIVNKKIYNILLNRNVSNTNNLDVVTYEHRNNTNFVDSLFTLMEQYIDLEIHKLTGITYTEYKSMTPLEKNIFLEHINYKVSVSNYDYEKEKEAMNEEEKKANSNNSNNSLFDVGGL